MQLSPETWDTIIKAIALILSSALMYAATSFHLWTVRQNRGKWLTAFGDRAERVMGWVVEYMNQVTVRDLKQRAADGKIDGEDLKGALAKVRADALERAMKLIPPKDAATYAREVPEMPLRDYLETLLEQYISGTKPLPPSNDNSSDSEAA